MATSAVAVGKIETALREGRGIPEGWVSREAAEPTLDEHGILSFDTPLLPLGGAGDETGGHKGYGLNLMVELMCGALSGTSFPDRIAGAAGNAPAAMAHFMGAIMLDGFRPVKDIHARLPKPSKLYEEQTRLLAMTRFTSRESGSRLPGGKTTGWEFQSRRRFAQTWKPLRMRWGYQSRGSDCCPLRVSHQELGFTHVVIIPDSESAKLFDATQRRGVTSP